MSGSTLQKHAIFFKITDFNKLFQINGNLITLLNRSLHKIVFQFRQDIK